MGLQLTSVLRLIMLRPLSEPLKPLKAFILNEEPLEPLKCLFGPLSAFIFTFEPLFSAFCPQNTHYLCFGVNFTQKRSFSARGGL